MVITSSKPISLKEFLALPETKPAKEYMSGKIIQKPMPKGKHSTIQTELSTAINLCLKSEKIARAFSELRCTFGDRSIVPDITILTWNNISRDDNGEISDSFYLAPDWVIEILSPEQSQTKVIKNILYCLENGTEMGWLIDPSDKSVLVYFSQQKPMFFDKESDHLPVPDFANSFQLTVGELFAFLLE
ncbi:Uma2 family endonuclease [Crocosphaera sp.]|uniref:Uma2 family endonuclease n=1 Tax=Crocosphaera sp. TaxID=2729996 RepID=UPI003F1E9E98